MGKINVFIKDPCKPPRNVWISNTLKNLQSIVGGYIETVTLASDFVVICDEEGRLKGKEHNCILCGIDFVGTIILAGVDDEKFANVPMNYRKAKEMLPQLWEVEA